MCTNLPKNKRLEFAWVLSSTPQMDESVRDTVNDLVDKYFDRSEMIVVDQSEETCEPRD